MKSIIEQLITNSLYEEPNHHWSYNRETRSFSLKTGRRLVGYLAASRKSKRFDDPGVFIIFDWIVSDFGLKDAIESGLVKTLRVVIRE